MEQKTVKDIQESYRTSIERLRQQMDKARESAEVTADMVIEQKTEMLDRMEQRLEQAQEAKAAAIRRFDEDIRHYQGVVSRLRSEIETEEKELAEAQGVTKKPRPKKAGKKAAKKTGRSSGKKR